MRSTPPRVLVAIKGLGIGGAERLISEGAHFWDHAKFEYHVAYAMPSKDQLVAELETLGIPVYCTDTTGSTSIPSVYGLRQLIRQLRPDLIHAHSPTVAIACRWASFSPVVYTEHNLAGSYHPAIRLLNRVSYGRNAAVIAVSPQVAASTHRYPGPLPEVILNGVHCRIDPEQAVTARSELGIGDQELLVVHVGNIRDGKGHANLIEATALLRRSMADIVVVSIGAEKRPGDLDRLRSLVKRHDLDGTLRFLGRRHDAASFIAACDVFINPSEVEGLPLAVLEAMALGKPIVATRVGGVPSVIRDGQNGLLVPPLAPLELAEAAARLLTDEEYAHILGAQARVDVEREHSLGTMVRRVESVYQRVLAE